MAQLFAAIRRAKVKPGMAQEFARRVETGALPVMQKMDGFKAYYLVFAPRTPSSRYPYSPMKRSPKARRKS